MAGFLRKPQAAQNTISEVKGAELSLASRARGWALPCPTFKYHTPRGLVGSPGLAQAEVARTGQEYLPQHPANICCWARIGTLLSEGCHRAPAQYVQAVHGFALFLWAAFLANSVCRQGFGDPFIKPILGTCFLVHCS